MTNAVKNVLLQPGDIRIEKIILLSTNFYVNLEDYLVELNIFESIFNNTMTGDIVLSDSRNLIKNAPIIGAEYLIIEVATPSLDLNIETAIIKTFRITSIEDRSVVRDQNTQLYKLKFVSQEAVVDSLQPLHYPFSGDISTIVSKIYNENIAIPRTYKLNVGKVSLDPKKTELIILADTANKVKFVSPGWTSFDCINWLAKKSIPKSGKACNFLFWETTKAFYFGSVESLFQRNELISGEYYYAPTGIRGVRGENNGTDDISEKMTLIQNMEILNGIDHLEYLENGYFANQLIEVDVLKKNIKSIEYSHPEKFKNYTHSEKNNPSPLYDKNAIINSHTHKRIYTKQAGLHTDTTNNYSERMGEIYGNRKSNLLDLNALRLNVTIYGRTDVEVGRTIHINYPDISPVTEEEKSKKHLDEKLTGDYLITAIHHKISKLKHFMSMEVIKDSYPTSKKDKI